MSRELCRLMKLPVDYFNNILTILELKHYASVMECFDYTGRKTLALYLVNNVLNTNTFIPTQELVRFFVDIEPNSLRLAYINEIFMYRLSRFLS